MTMQIDAQALRAMPDLQLERFAADGDKPAFGELYERYSSRVHDFLMRMVRDPDEAADLMQETFVRAMKSLSAERAGGAQFSTYLFTIARNLALTRLDRKKRTVPLSTDDDGDEPAEYQHVDLERLSNPGDAIEAKELSELVWRAAKALDPKQYSLLDLHVRQGLESAEIAQVLGVSKGNAYTMLSRLRDQFESAVAGVLMFQRGRRACADLDTMLTENEVTAVSPAARKLIERHTSRCATCQGQRRQFVSARQVLGALVILPLPLLLKRRVAEASWEAACSPAGGGAGGAAGGAGSSPAQMLGTAARVVVQPFTIGVVQVVLVGVAVIGVAVPGAVLVGPRAFDAVQDTLGIGSGDRSSADAKLPCTPAQPVVLGPASPDPALAVAMLDRGNAYRTQRGLPALTTNPLLDDAAAEYAEFVVQTRWWTAALGSYIHLGADCRDMFDRATAHGYPNALVAENVMWGSLGVPPDLMFDALLASPHEDPANPLFSDTGIACYAREASPAEVACVQVFAQAPGS